MQLRRIRFLRYAAVQWVVTKRGGITQRSFGIARRAEDRRASSHLINDQ